MTDKEDDGTPERFRLPPNVKQAPGRGTRMEGWDELQELTPEQYAKVSKQVDDYFRRQAQKFRLAEIRTAFSVEDAMSPSWEMKARRHLAKAEK